MFTVRIKKAPHFISGLFDVTTLNMCHMLRSTLRIFARVRSWSAYPFPTADIRYIFFLTMSSVPEPRWGPRPQIPSSIADNFCRLRPWTVYQLCQSIFIIVYTNGARRTNAASTCYDEFHIADGLPLSCCCRHGLSRYWFRTAAGPEPGWLYYGSRSAASRQRVDAFLRRSIRCGFCPSEVLTFHCSRLCSKHPTNSSSAKWSTTNTICCTNASHLRQLVALQNYHLRPRTHNRQLPDHSGHLTDSNFFTRLL